MNIWFLFSFIIFGVLLFIYICKDDPVEKQKTILLPHKEKQNHKNIFKEDDIVRQIKDYSEIGLSSKTVKMHQKNNAAKSNKIYIQQILQSLDLNSDHSKIDQAFIEFLMNPTVPRQEKISILWNLAAHFYSDKGKFYYVLDHLEVLRPIELTNDIINSYNKADDINIKLTYLYLLGTSLEIANPEKQNEEQLSDIANYTELISALLENELRNENKELSREALRLYAGIAPVEDVEKLLIESIHNSEGSQKSEILDIYMTTAFSTEEAQLLLAIPFLGVLEDSEESIKRDINTHLYQLLKLGNINHNIKDDLANYIERQKPGNYSTNKYPDYLRWFEERFHWLSAYASLKSDNIISKTEFMALHVKESNDPVFQANIIVYADSNVLSLIRFEDKEFIVQSFQTKLLDNSIQSDERDLITSAIEILKPD